MKKNLNVIGLLVVLLAMVACSSPSTPAPTPESTQPPPTKASAATEAPQSKAIVVGDVGDTPSQIIEDTQPLADYLAKNLAQYGITRGEVKVAASIDEMAQLMKDGKVDLYFDSVYPATLVSDASGAKVFIRRWKSGVSEYHTVIFASKKSGLTTLSQLKGHMMTGEQNYSTSGYMIPLAYLIKQGLTVTSDEIGFVFSGDDDNTVQWVLSGLVSAGATDNIFYGKLKPEVRDQFVVLAETESLPRQVGVLQPGIDPTLQTAITQILIDADKSDEGQAALAKFSKTTKFDLFPEGIDAALAHIRELVNTVKAARKP